MFPDPSAQVTVKRSSGLSLIVTATTFSGVVGYLITWFVARQVGPASYAVFAVFWAALYLIVSGLSGIQQEVTRATRAVATVVTPRIPRVRNFALVAAPAVFIVIVATAPLWVDRVFPSEGWRLVWPLAVGTASYVLVAIVCGSLYGLSQWWSLAWMIVVDPVLRFVGLVVGLMLTSDVVVLAWVVAVPLPATVVLIWPLIRRRVVGRSDIDAGYRQLTWNMARTMLAAASMGALISGFPLLLGLTSPTDPPAEVGVLILAITLTRAPLIVTTMSLQSYLIIRFRDHPGALRNTFLGLQGLVLASAVMLALLGWSVGPTVFVALFGEVFAPAGWLIAALVGSSALVAALCICAPVALARGQHFLYSAGWFVAALATIAALVLPMDLVARTVLALMVGPAAGLAVHGISLIWPARWSRPPSRWKVSHQLSGR